MIVGIQYWQVDFSSQFNDKNEKNFSQIRNKQTDLEPCSPLSIMMHQTLILQSQDLTPCTVFALLSAYFLAIFKNIIVPYAIFQQFYDIGHILSLQR